MIYLLVVSTVVVHHSALTSTPKHTEEDEEEEQEGGGGVLCVSVGVSGRVRARGAARLCSASAQLRCPVVKESTYNLQSRAAGAVTTVFVPSAKFSSVNCCIVGAIFYAFAD